LKENIEKIAVSDSGINIYKFNFIGEDITYQGVIAQELINTEFEKALIIEDDFYKVDYSQIDVEFKKLNI
jgi:hypothetical protein